MNRQMNLTEFHDLAGIIIDISTPTIFMITIPIWHNLHTFERRNAHLRMANGTIYLTRFSFLIPFAATVDFLVLRIGLIATLLLLGKTFGPIRDTIKSTVATSQGVGIMKTLVVNRILKLRTVPWTLGGHTLHSGFCRFGGLP